jgi:hypothetical protein
MTETPAFRESRVNATEGNPQRGFEAFLFFFRSGLLELRGSCVPANREGVIFRIDGSEERLATSLLQGFGIADNQVFSVTDL